MTHHFINGCNFMQKGNDWWVLTAPEEWNPCAPPKYRYTILI